MLLMSRVALSDKDFTLIRCLQSLLFDETAFLENAPANPLRSPEALYMAVTIQAQR